MPTRQNTDPPLDRPKQIAENVWIVDSGPMMAMGILPLPVRMTIVRSADGGLRVHSATRFFAVLLRQREELGPIRHFVTRTVHVGPFLGNGRPMSPAPRPGTVTSNGSSSMAAASMKCASSTARTRRFSRA
ncbi:hypothetical protein [Rhizobium sp. PP-F2F-G48]|uniref:hypothetical protein n=1 Tax=Rhizobium sp. PP-F2F-G48 TaxID=2135651 RepID=UPI00104B20BD|nr:hypothetical protein [Rhizobium sp. PP-F2F-G48]